MDIDQLPIFPWESYRVTLDDKFLYHYTKAESLLKILETMTLRPSSFANLNDLAEGKVNWISFDWEHMESQFSFEDCFIKQNCSMISFTTNYRRGNDDSYEPTSGALHPRMWAQYAENNFGACIVFRKDVLEAVIEREMKAGVHRFAILDKVKYSILSNNEVPIKKTKASSFIKQNYKSLFFTKDIDWEGENEYRYLGVKMPDTIDITNAIQYICFGSSFFEQRNDGKDYGKLLVKLLMNPNSRCYEYFNSKSFSQISCDAGGYHEHPADNWVEGVLVTIEDEKKQAETLCQMLEGNKYEI